MAEIITAIIALVSGFAGGLTLSWFARRDRLDQSLKDKRHALYADLWQLTGRIPLYPHDEGFSPEKAGELMHRLRTWYFDENGGLYMSKETQDLYVAFQKLLAETRTFDHSDPKDWLKQYGRVQVAGSALRTGMTQDLHSRSAAWRI